ncbi:MAG: rhombosortase [Gammaproteobacteria bacterium]|nr:rhombosortase [Gammaproteobacteria bacterium]
MPVLRESLPVFIISLIMLLLQLLGPELLRYDSRFLQHAEYWRFLSGHWVHANWIHFGLNIAGFTLCLALTGVRWALWQWGWRIIVLSTAISSGFIVWQPQLGWYVGFSGVLFGLYVLAAVASLSEQRMMSVILLIFIALKIILEQGASVNITSSELIGIPVLVDAHLYGVLSATLVVLAQRILNKLIYPKI